MPKTINHVYCTSGAYSVYVCINADVHMHAYAYYKYTSSEAHLLRASLLRRAVNSILAKALWRQCFNESTSNVSCVDDIQLGNWSKAMPIATMWQRFRVIYAYACMYNIMNEDARYTYACMYMNLPANAMLICRTQAEHFRSRCEDLLSRTNYQEWCSAQSTPF